MPVRVPCQTGPQPRHTSFHQTAACLMPGIACPPGGTRHIPSTHPQPGWKSALSALSCCKHPTSASHTPVTHCALRLSGNLQHITHNTHAQARTRTCTRTHAHTYARVHTHTHTHTHTEHFRATARAGSRTLVDTLTYKRTFGTGRRRSQYNKHLVQGCGIRHKHSE